MACHLTQKEACTILDTPTETNTEKNDVENGKEHSEYWTPARDFPFPSRKFVPVNKTQCHSAVEAFSALSRNPTQGAPAVQLFMACVYNRATPRMSPNEPALTGSSSRSSSLDLSEGKRQKSHRKHRRERFTDM